MIYFTYFCKYLNSLKDSLLPFFSGKYFCNKWAYTAFANLSFFGIQCLPFQIIFAIDSGIAMHLH